MAETRQQRAERLADLVIERVIRNGECTDDDLFRAGFTTDDLHDLGPLVRNTVLSVFNAATNKIASLTRTGP
jgi:hypothetical protein